MATIQLKEFNQQHAQIFIGVSGIDARVKLRSECGNSKFYHCFNIDSTTTGTFHILLLYLQETDDHEDETVRADSSGEDFVQVPLQQKLLQHKDQVRQHWVHLKEGDVE